MVALEILDEQVSQASHGEQLSARLELVPELRPYLDHLAVTRRYTALRDAGTLNENDELANGQLARLMDDDFEQSTHEQERHGLSALFLDIVDAIEDDPGALRGGAVDWQRLALGLLRQEPPIKTHEFNGEIYRPNRLESAFACALLADSQDVREHFITTVYDMDLQEKMTVTLKEGCLTYIINPSSDTRVIKRFNNYADAFQSSGSEVDYYLDRITPITHRANGPTKPKVRQKEVCQAYQEGVVDEDIIAKAESESLAHEDKQSRVIDPNKIERFALERMFIEEQVQLIFPEGSFQGSPLVCALAEKRAPAVVNQLVKLHDDIQEALSELTKPLIEKYQIDPAVSRTMPLTRRQSAAKRFREIWQRRIELQGIAKYINYSESYPPLISEREIWSVAEGGVDISRQSRALVSTLLNEVLHFSQQTGDTPKAEELYQLTQTTRKYLMRVAMINVMDFRELTLEGHMKALAVKLPEGGEDETEARPLRMSRRVDGSLDIALPLATQKIKDIAPVHEGITLGCVAGRIALEGMKNQDRGLHATDSFVDYLLEIIIDEAHARSIFDLENYQ